MMRQFAQAAHRKPWRQSAVRYALVGLLVTCGSGASCSRTLRSPFAPWTPPAPEVLATGSSLDEITAAVNQNAARIHSYQTNNASIKATGVAGIPTLSGQIAAQRPGRVRLQAKTTITGKEVDLGANDELFWFWVRRNQPPAVYYARHDQFAGSGAQQLMPIEPEWLLDALGFAEFKPTDFHEGPLPLDEDRVEIKSTVQSRTGPLTKRTVIDSRRAWILEQHVYDAAGTLVASAVAKSHRYHPQAGISLPQEIELRLPAADMALSIDVGTVQINTLVENPELWALPVIPGSPATDLGRLPAGGGGVPRMGDQLTRADWRLPPPASAAPMVAAASPVAASGPALSSLPMGGVPQFALPGAPTEAPPGGAAGAQRLPAGGIATSTQLVR